MLVVLLVVTGLPFPGHGLRTAKALSSPTEGWGRHLRVPNHWPLVRGDRCQTK